MTTTFAVAGDSLTAGTNMSYPAWDGIHLPATWGAYLTPAVEEIGGYARSGAKVADIYTNMPIGSLVADKLVLFVGANDARDATPVDTFKAHIKNIILRSHIGTVVVVGCPPRNDGNDRADRASAMFHALKDLAAPTVLGWTFVDPWVAIRTPSGNHYSAGWSTDGVHPTIAGFQHIAPLIEAAILT